MATRNQSPIFKYSQEEQQPSPNNTIVYYSIPTLPVEPSPPPEPTENPAPATNSVSPNSGTSPNPSPSPAPPVTPSPSPSPIVTTPPWATTSDKVDALLRGMPAHNLYRVTFSEPITFHYWKIVFKKDMPTTTWQITGDKITVEFEKFGTEFVLLTPISGRHFEFKMTPVQMYSVDVTIKITRGMTVMCSLAAEPLMDCRFIVEGKEIHANSHLLAARSDVLRSALHGPMREGCTKEFKITDASYEAVSIFLKYMAVDKLDPTTDVVILIDVYKLAHRYLVPMIQDETAFRITNLTDKTNYVSILQAAQSCKAQQIISAVLSKVLNNEFKDSAELMSQLFV